MNALRSRRGFTLLELLTAVVIIGTLTALIYPQISGVKKRTYVDAVANDLRNLVQQQEVLYATQSRYSNDASEADLRFTSSDKVLVTIDYVSPDGRNWLATGRYLSYTDGECAVAIGPDITALIGYADGKVECAMP